jgi:hypothetical protein
VSSRREGRASLAGVRKLALLLAVSAAFLGLATTGSARPQTTNPGGYVTVRVVVTAKGATIGPTHARRGQIGIFLVSNHTSGIRVFSLGDHSLTHHRGSGFAVKLAANQQKRVLVTLDYRGPLPASVAVGGKAKVVGAFIIT